MTIKHGGNRSRARPLPGLLILTIILVWFVTGCQGETPTPIATVQPPTVGEPKVSAATPLKPGQEAGISVDVYCPTGVTLTYTWYADHGEIVRGQGSPAITYRAPDEPGVYNVRLMAKWDGQSVEKSTSVEVGPPMTSPVSPTSPPQPPTDTPPEPSTATPTTSPDVIPTLLPDTITLTSLEDGQSVPCENAARGAYSSDITNPIWPIVYIASRYHPQDEGGEAPSMINGKWYGTVRFGDCSQPPDYDRGKDFQLIIVTADEQANREFEDYLAACLSTGEWPGMDELPPGAKVYLRIVVTRQ